VTLGVTVAVRVSVPGGLTEGALDGDAPNESEPVGVAVVLGDCEADGLPVSLVVDDCVAVSETLLVPVAVNMDVALAVSEAVPDGLGRTVLEGEALGRMLRLMLTVDVALALAVCDALEVRLTEGVSVSEGVPLDDRVAVRV